MKSPIVFLSSGLVLAYFVWLAAPWKSDSAAILPTYLIAVAVQCLHFTEEYVTGFQHQFTPLFGDDWSNSRFVAFNLLWLAVFVTAGLGVLKRVPLAYIPVLFLGLVGGVGNGCAHLLLSIRFRRYFPGAVTCGWRIPQTP